MRQKHILHIVGYRKVKCLMYGPLSCLNSTWTFFIAWQTSKQLFLSYRARVKWSFVTEFDAFHNFLLQIFEISRHIWNVHTFLHFVGPLIPVVSILTTKAGGAAFVGNCARFLGFPLYGNENSGHFFFNNLPRKFPFYRYMSKTALCLTKYLRHTKQT